MKSALNNKYALLLFDLLIVLICAAGLYQVHLKAALPFTLSTGDDYLLIRDVQKDNPGINTGNIFLAVDNQNLNHTEEVELYLDGKKTGDIADVLIQQDGVKQIFNVTLTHYYTTFDLITIGIVGLFFIVFAILVRIKAPQNKFAKLFYISSLGLAMVIMMTAGNYSIVPFGYGYANRILWLTAYTFTPVLFIHFTKSFIKPVRRKPDRILPLLYSMSGINLLVLGYYFIYATLGSNEQSIREYVFYYSSIFRIFVLACIIIAISICIYAYKRATDLEERKRLQWLLLGFFIGPFSFVIFWILPIMLTGHSLFPEAAVLLFLTAIPITFSIAIVKYHLMDIILIVRRSLVYSIILALIVIAYTGLSSVITLFIHNVNPAFPSIILAIAVVVTLQPLKIKIQKFVDKKFFRVEYDFRKEQKKFLDDIKSPTNLQTLAEKIVEQTNSLIPVDKIGFFILKPDNRIKMVASKGWDLLKERTLRFEIENLKTDLSLPVAVDDKIEPGLLIESADIKVFKRWGMVLVFPVKSPNGTIYAFLAMGTKKSGKRYLKDDIDLLILVSDAAALAIERINLQEELILEKLEAERLEELNRMKSFFVSTVSHELKTPLTSIKMFTELLQGKASFQDDRSKDYLKIIDGESDKLKRLIDNILDFTKIEKGMKFYEMKRVNAGEIVFRALYDIQYLAKMAKQKVVMKEVEKKFIIKADADAVERAVVNLISNAIKYSSSNSATTVSIIADDEFTGIQIRDEGQGISKEQQDKIFEAFYRSDKENLLKAEGTGLGLAIVKHIMDAHNGRIEVESEVGEGSTFTLWFPVDKDE